MDKTVYGFNELPPELQAQAGGKAASLAKLTRLGCPVPPGFVLLPGAFAGDDLLPAAWGQARAQLDVLRAGNPGQAFAVRSSARSEDSPGASFAGEFETRLNLATDEQICAAIQLVRRSRFGERARAYSQARGMAAGPEERLAQEMAVVVQVLAPAVRSGVLFTADPTGGDRSRVVINAAWGLGEAIVSGQVTPDLVVVEKGTGRIVTSQVAAKEVMTVRVAGGTQERPVEGPRQKQAVLSRAEARRLAEMGERIQACYGLPMDIEWAADGAGFYILQARPITALPDPPPPARWKLPRGAYAAMRVNIIELMAEPLSPLFESLGLDVINPSLNQMLDFFMGRPGIMPERAIVAVNHYAYYNGSLKPANIAWLLLHMRSIARRMFAGPVERWTEQGRPAYLAALEKWQAVDWRRRLSNREILQAARELFAAAIAAYWSMVGGLLPAAWISEALFTYFYRLLIKRRGDPQAPVFLLGFESLPIRADCALYALAGWARGREALARYLADTPADQLAAHLGLAASLDNSTPPEGLPAPDWAEWRLKVQDHLARYGHTIYDLDFANPLPADDPAPLLDTCKLYLGGAGADPLARQQAAARRREAAVSALRGRLQGWRRKQFDRLLALAQRFAPLREDALADIGLAYPLLRQMLGCLGARLVAAGAIRQPGEVYQLTGQELADACQKLDRSLLLENLSPLIPERQAARRSARRATPPERLPHFARPRLKRQPAGERGVKAPRSLAGVPASAGCVTAPARVLHGPEDFAQMAAGEVLVARLTTPAWTPLFARAAAIVTDVGGPLSHGSIVAREYGIPAVLGTGQATRCIQSGQLITVDGSRGRVTLHPQEGLG